MRMSRSSKRSKSTIQNLPMPACDRTSIRLASSTGRSGDRASERFMVAVEFKPKRTAMAFHKLTHENAQMSREREPEYVAWASPCSYPWADDRILLYEIYDSRARPFHLRSPVLAAFDKTSADWS